MSAHKKTIFITINRGILVRNFFRSGLLKKLIQTGDVYVVVLIPEHHKVQPPRELFAEFELRVGTTKVPLTLVTLPGLELVGFDEANKPAQLLITIGVIAIACNAHLLTRTNAKSSFFIPISSI